MPSEDASPRQRKHHAANDIASAARLYDEGKLSADEFEHLKREALQY